jgi:hypothetical protein
MMKFSRKQNHACIDARIPIEVVTITHQAASAIQERAGFGLCIADSRKETTSCGGDGRGEFVLSLEPLMSVASARGASTFTNVATLALSNLSKSSNAGYAPQNTCERILKGTQSRR